MEGVGLRGVGLSPAGGAPPAVRARAMRDRDYLWCLANGLLDREEELERLCPSCRARALEGCCPACGQSLPEEETGNPTFDLERFEALKEGKGLD